MKRIISITVILLLASISFSQTTKQKKYYLNGYLSYMNQTIIDSINGNWVNDGLVHNRLMFNYFGVKNLTFDLEVRNRLMYGETAKYTPNYSNYFDVDRGFFDLSFNVADGNSYVLNSNIDRLYFQYEVGKFKATIGRQRINWGMTFVWNPNDLFNNYSFFDFDYGEKPGSDAINIQYFRNYASSIEFAAKLNSDTALTAAMMYKFNLLNYDFQIIAGSLNNQDVVGGLGWSGNIWQFSFRGEGSYLHPVDNFSDTSGAFVASLGFDYMFTNSTIITAEFLYNQAAGNLNVDNIFKIQDAPMNVKSLSFSKYSAVLQVAYPISPVINTSIAAMWMSANNWFFLSPNIGFAISQDVEFSFVSQIFTGKMLNPISLQKEQKLISLIYLRFKYSF
ncbi:MAG: hypothetical protein JXR68_04345 [Bacteroidales bacterium]|nr:hypothetical protein [Bacteroidales bacterium]